MRFASIAAAFALALPVTLSLAAAQPAPLPNPREIATQVAQAVDDNYFDVARGQAVAEGLRARARRGDFDRIAKPLDLATALTAYLHPFDGHFNVIYMPDAEPWAGEPPRIGPGPESHPGPGSAPRLAPTPGPQSRA